MLEAPVKMVEAAWNPVTEHSVDVGLNFPETYAKEVSKLMITMHVRDISPLCFALHV